MKWRRKVFALTLALGTGVFCFGPMLTHSLSRRLSSDWNANAKVTSARLALGNSSLSMEGLVVEHPDFSLSGKQILLQLNSEQLWYRDCLIDSLLARGVVWKLNRETNHASDSPWDTNNPIQETAALLSSFEERCSQQELEIQRQLNAAQELVGEAERISTAKVRLISTKVGELEASVEGLRSPEQLANPLRANKRIESIRSIVQDIKWMLAEERDEQKVLSRRLQDAIAQIQGTSTLANTTTPAPAIDLEALSGQIALALIEYTEQQLAPYANASELASDFLVSNASTADRSSGRRSFSLVELGTDAALPGVPPRSTRIAKGKILGQSVVAGTLEDVEIAVITNNRGVEQLDGKVNISWHTPADANANGQSATQGSFKTQTQKEKLVEKHLQLHRTKDAIRMNLQSSLGDEMRESTASITLNAITEIELIKPLGLSTNSIPTELMQSSIHAVSPRFVGRFATESEVDATGPVAKWTFKDHELQPIKDWLGAEIARRTDERIQSLSTTIKSQSDTEIHRLTTRVQVVESTLKDRQQEWNRKIELLLANAADWESQQLRLSAPASNTIR